MSDGSFGCSLHEGSVKQYHGSHSHILDPKTPVLFLPIHHQLSRLLKEIMVKSGFSKTDDTMVLVRLRKNCKVDDLGGTSLFWFCVGFRHLSSVC